MTTLANRPAAHLISYAAECFETVGEKTTYSVGYVAGYATDFGADYAAAKAHADKCSAEVTTTTTPAQRRVRWN